VYFLRDKDIGNNAEDKMEEELITYEYLEQLAKETMETETPMQVPFVPVPAKEPEAELREELERERRSFVATLEEKERVLNEREEMVRKREENVLDREEELDIREKAEEIRSQILGELLEEESEQLQKARWFFWMNAAAAAFWICWSLIKIVA
jgi:hypothetical protein